MKPNAIFSMKRFSRFLSAYMQLNYKRYLFIFAGAWIGLFAILFYNMYGYQPFLQNRYIDLFSLCLIGIGAFIGSALPELSDKIKSGNYLLLPASAFEKIVSQFLIYVVGSCIVCILLYWLNAHLARWVVMHTERFHSYIHTIDIFRLSDLLDAFKAPIIFGLFSTACFLFAARFYFTRYSLVKSVIAGIAILYLGFLFLVLCSHLFFPESEGLNIAIPVYKIAKDIDNVELIAYVFAYLSWLFFLPLAYFKLKEKQV
jgi:hypothetical protein